MKRYIDEGTGKIVNILNNDEANKVVKIFIDFFFTETTMPEGRLNLVVLLRDFIKLTEMENIYKFIEYIEEYKKSLKLSKDDEKDFDVLYRFFKAYKDFSEPTINIEDAKNYISDMTNKEEELSKKPKDSLDKTEKILNVLFENGFVLCRLAKISCDTWENKIQNQIKNDKKEAIISIEQEIAYQDLLEFASKEKVGTSKKISSKDVNTNSTNSTNENKEKEKVNESEISASKNSKVSIDVQVPEKKEPIKIEVETKKAEINDKKEEKIENVPNKEVKTSTIQINHGFDIGNNVTPEPQITINANKPENIQKEKVSEKKEDKGPEIQINRGIQIEDDVPQRPSKPQMQDKAENISKIDNSQNKVEKEPTIQINRGIQIDDVPQKPKPSANDQKPQVDNNLEKNKKDEGYISNIHIYVPGVDDEEKEPKNVSPLEIKNATEDVNLKDSVEFFSSVLDSRRSNDDDEEDSFRD